MQKRNKKILILMFSGVTVFLYSLLFAQTTVADINNEVKLLKQELYQLKQSLNVDEIITSKSSLSGLSRGNDKLSIGGYGEILYENYSKKDENGADSNKVDKIDMLRAVFFVGYNFTDIVKLQTEIEIEHGNEIFVEQLYLDFQLSKIAGIKTGLLLTPMGFINEKHEPPLFFSKRPLTEQYIIPSTWRELGIGMYGVYKIISYKLYALTSLNGANFSDSNGLRGGRQKGIKAKAEDFSLVANINVNPFNSFSVGSSIYYGDSGHDNSFKATTRIIEAHAEFKAKGFQARTLFAQAIVADAREINELDTTAATNVGSELRGWYAELGYNVFRPLHFKTKLIVFGRYERINTQYKTADGYNHDKKNNQTIVTVGGHFLPIPKIAIKADYQWISNKAKTGVNQTNISVGYMF